MNFRGRQIDPVELWSKYIDLPANLEIDEQTVFLPKVECPNPEHDTGKRHFQVNVTQPTVHCFAYCGISGSYEKAISIIEGCDEREAKRIILRNSSRSGRSVKPRRRISGRAKQAASVVSDLGYERFLPQAGLEYLKSRGISDESVATWELGWDSESLRIVIPARDLNGHLRFLIKRATREKDHPKYLYSEGFPKTSLLFGACQLDLGMVRSEGLILTEGSLDAIDNHRHGLRNTTAILGTGISRAQRAIVAKLRPKRVYLMFDKDLAGVTNIEIAARELRKYPLFVCRYPKGKNDPQELSREEKYRSIERAVPAYSWLRKNFPSVQLTRRIASG